MKYLVKLNQSAAKLCFIFGVALLLAGCGGTSSTQNTLRSITVTPDPIFIGTGTTLNLTATGNYSDGTTVDLTSQATWTTADPLTASVDSTGKLAAVASSIGATTTLTATYNGMSSHAVNVTVTSGGSFSTSTGLITARFDHTATLLNDGRVLVTGGYGTSGAALASSELYDPTTKLWTDNTGMLIAGRGDQTATLLIGGKVLVAGGVNSVQYDVATAELYNPASGTWATAGDLVTPRSYHTLTLFADGTVLLVGGVNSGNCSGCGLGIINNAEIYDPTTGTTGSWTATGSLAMNRYSHTATLLKDGNVLVVGGFGGPGAPTLDSALDSAELYQATGTNPRTWMPTSNLHTRRYSHTATLLDDGTVLVAGGSDGAGNDLASAEIYDPTTYTWTVVGSLGTVRFDHRATLMPDGQVLVTGGANSQSANLDSAELYDPGTQKWSATGNLQTGRIVHTATLLAHGSALTDGQVLLVGGDGTSGVLSSVELHN